MKVLFYIQYRSLVNGLKQTLKSPKSWIPALIILLTLGGFLSMLIFLAVISSSVHPRNVRIDPHIFSLVRSALFFALLFLSTQSVIFSLFKESPLTFTPADVDFLFPSPIARKLVLTYKRLLSYLVIFFGSAFITLMVASMPLGLMGVGLFPHILIIWSGFVMLGITMSNLANTTNLVFARRIEAIKWASLTTKYVGAIFFIGFMAAIFWLGISAADNMSVLFRKGPSMLEPLNRAANILWVKILFLPFTMASDLLISPFSRPAYPPVLAFFGLLALTVGSHYLLLSRREDIYEPSLAASQRMAQIMSAARRGESFTLSQQMQAQNKQGKKMRTLVPPFGRREWALLWKNTVIMVRTLNPMGVFMGIVMIVFLVAFMDRIQSHALHGLRSSGQWVFYVLFFGTRISQSNTRQELRQGWLKGMPLKGWKVITAQTIYQTLPVFLFLTIVMLIFEPLRTASRLAMVLLVVPSTAAALAAAGNLGAVLYPKLTDMTQNFLSGLISSILGFIPLSAAGLTLVMLPRIGFSEVVTGAVAASFNLACAVVMIALSGHLYDKVDLTMES